MSILEKIESLLKTDHHSCSSILKILADQKVLFAAEL